MKGDGAGGSRVRLRAAWRRIPRRRRPRRPGGPAARRSACVLHAVAMFVQQQVAVVVACVCGVSLRSCACEKNCCCLSVLSQPQCYRPVLVRCAPDSIRRGRYTDRRCYCYTRRCYFPLPQHPDFTSSPTCFSPVGTFCLWVDSSESPRTAMLAPPGAPDAAHWWIPLVAPLVVVIDPAVRAAGGQRGGGERARCAGSD